MMHWKHLRRDIVASERMQKLLQRNPLAYALYINAKAVCDDYGRLHGTPLKFKGCTAPMINLEEAEIEAALADMEAANVISFYEVDGDKYLEIVDYNKIEETDWKNVGKPEYPHPDGWTPPEDLVTLLQTTTDHRLKPSRYGLSDTFYNQAVARPSPDRRPTVARPSPEDTESESESESDNVLTSLVENAGDGPASSDETVPDPAAEKLRLKQEKSQRDAERMEKQTRRLTELFTSLPDGDAALLDRMIAGQATVKGKELTLLQQVNQAEMYVKELAEHGPQCWHECCEIACTKEKFTVEYAKGCTRNWTPEESRSGGNYGQGTPSGAYFDGPAAGSRDIPEGERNDVSSALARKRAEQDDFRKRALATAGVETGGGSIDSS